MWLLLVFLASSLLTGAISVFNQGIVSIMKLRTGFKIGQVSMLHFQWKFKCRFLVQRFRVPSVTRVFVVAFSRYYSVKKVFWLCFLCVPSSISLSLPTTHLRRFIFLSNQLSSWCCTRSLLCFFIFELCFSEFLVSLRSLWFQCQTTWLLLLALQSTPYAMFLVSWSCHSSLTISALYVCT